MQFDHRDPETKLFAITSGRAMLKSREKLLAEIAKCDIVCANCHALRTYGQLLARKARLAPHEWAPGKSRYIEEKRRRWQRNVRLLNDLRDVPCADCGRRFPPYVMHFDHRDSATKRSHVTRLISRGRNVILEEVAKCDIVCANCHSNRTYQRRMAARGCGVMAACDPSKVEVRVRFPSPAPKEFSQASPWDFLPLPPPRQDHLTLE